jgi:hypothetical protein
MIVAFLAAALAAAAQPAPMPALSPARAVAEDVAQVSTDVCYRLATGELRWAPRNVNEEIAQVEAAGLEYGAPGTVIDAMGGAGRIMVNRATMASRTNGDFHIVLANGGSMPGCRVMLAGDELPGTADAVGSALVAAGWTALPEMTDTRGALERRLFIRFGPRNEPYIANLMVVSDPSARLRLYTQVAKVPPNVRLPAGIGPATPRP